MSTVATPLHGKENCGCAGEFRRLKYFYGQMLSAQDFQLEQDFFRDKLKLHNRCLHGYGVVCGLLVEPIPLPRECVPVAEVEREKELKTELEKLVAERTRLAEAAGNDATIAEIDKKIDAIRKQLDELYEKHCREKPRTRIQIGCGLGLDCEGNELVVGRPLHVDLLQSLSSEDYRRVEHGAHAVYVSLCYCEQGVERARPVLADSCGASPECVYGKVQDAVRVEVTLDPPKHDERCETCCGPCEECCLLLAKITGLVPGQALHSSQIHNQVRRPLSRYVPTTITGVSWQHGHTYTQEQAKRLMGTDHQPDEKGLKISFSRPVAVSTLRHGVMDTWVIEGGGGRAGNIYHKRGKFVDLPSSGYADHIFYRDTTNETLEPGDRVLIILRTNFILDKCCQPVDGENVGGRVPILAEYAKRYGIDPQFEVCKVPPIGYGPWHSGDGIPGGTFESWFYIKEREREHGREGREATS